MISYSLLVHQLPLRRYMSDGVFLQFHLQLLLPVSLFNVVKVEIFSHRVNGVLWLLEKIIKIEKSITRLYSHQRATAFNRYHLPTDDLCNYYWLWGR